MNHALASTEIMHAVPGAARPGASARSSPSIHGGTLAARDEAEPVDRDPRARLRVPRGRPSQPGALRTRPGNPAGRSRAPDRPLRLRQDHAADLDRRPAQRRDRRAGRARARAARLRPAELVEVRRSIGFIFQMHNLLDFLTARQNVQMALQLHPELSRRGDRGARGARSSIPSASVRCVRRLSRPISPAGRSSGSRSRAHSPAGHASCSPTSRPPRSTARPAARSSTDPATGPRGRLHDPDGHPRRPDRRRRRPAIAMEDGRIVDRGLPERGEPRPRM